MTNPHLDGKRVLVVEDEFLLAMMMEDLLLDEGCIVVGPFSRVAEALVAARNEEIDLAVLDVNVAEEKVFPVATQLEARGVPFILLTGYGQKAIPDDCPHWEAHSKPYDPQTLIDVLAAKVNQRY
ncbi:response regulator [Loktanella sp. M215]|uniref:response regulator n=1 Tax=Loktanella sp. M215 TaxID=2675431 RepID=UPI001F00F69F|nr:response regulator [Loktanella sp. M215]MCF7701611.1 response regulator [Loktanella sp. M215]